MNKVKFTELIKTIYKTVEELEDMFPGRHFTPDGHMVGSIGEALVCQYYGVKLASASTKTHDGVGRDGRNIQIKATQGTKITLSSNPDFLIVISIKKDGDFDEIYNGPGSGVWDTATANKKKPKNGQYPISFTQLKELNKSICDENRIKKLNP